MPMPDMMIQRARTRLGVTDRELARQLGVTQGCLRSWDRKGAPRYAQLALLALMAGLVPETVETPPVVALRQGSMPIAVK
jgi:DNA-binding transcriptional regulator YiaG